MFYAAGSCLRRVNESGGKEALTLTDNQNVPLILHVEDDDSHAALMKESFQDTVGEYRLEIAGTLRDARAAIERLTPNLVLTIFLEYKI